MFTGLFDFFNQGWVGSLIGLIGITIGVVGIFSYKIARSSPRLVFQKYSLRLLGRDENSLPPEVKVTYKGEEVQRLTKSSFVFWNKGTETLDGKNIVRDDPLTLVFDEGVQILSYNIIKVTKDVNKFFVSRAENKNNSLVLYFDYLDSDDGAVLEILHDGAQRYPKIAGTIKGMPEACTDLGRLMVNRSIGKDKTLMSKIMLNPKSMMVLILFLGISMVIFGLLPPDAREAIALYLPKKESAAEGIVNEPWFLVLFGIFYSLVPIIFFWSKRKKFPKQLEWEDMDIL